MDRLCGIISPAGRGSEGERPTASGDAFGDGPFDQPSGRRSAIWNNKLRCANAMPHSGTNRLDYGSARTPS